MVTAIKLKDITGTITSPKRLTNAVAAAAGLGATGYIESSAFRALPGVFGEDTGASRPTAAQSAARQGLRAAEAVTGLLMVAKGKGAVQAAGYGMAAGGTWHIARDLVPALNPV